MIAMGELSLKQVYGGPLVPAEQVIALLRDECNVSRVRDFQKAVEAARRLDGENESRRNYWGKLAIFSERRLGELIREGQANGKIAKRGNQPKSQKGHDDPFVSLEDIGISRNQSKRAQKLADVPEEKVEAYIAESNGDEVSKAGLLKFATNGRANGDPHVSSNSGCNEWYTPPEFIAASRKVLGKIDLDPATSAAAQEIVKARKFFTQADDGLAQHWTGRVFLNPPYSSDLVHRFTNKLTAHHVAGDVPQAILLTNNATETQWFQFCAQQAAAVCFPAGRIKYLDANGEAKNSPLQGQVFLYFGDSVETFDREFARFGLIMEVPHAG